MEQSKQSELIRTALENVKSMVDANTVTGTPITTESGTVIIPVSKVFVGIASGGIDYFGKKSTTEKNFGGGGGTGVTVSPLGFLVISPKGKVELLNIEAPSVDPVTRVVDFVENTPELIEKIKKLFPKKEKDDEVVD
ncbi:MAG: sporulation protein YtfJ [Clostridia bacterium]|nr:sporulation protein YtfJ [Clostridia bacterium]